MRSHRLRLIEREASVRRDPERRFRTAAVLGLGYVGLPTAAVFANAGVDVLGVDVNEKIVASIAAGRAPTSITNAPRTAVRTDSSRRERFQLMKMCCCNCRPFVQKRCVSVTFARVP